MKNILVQFARNWRKSSMFLLFTIGAAACALLCFNYMPPTLPEAGFESLSEQNGYDQIVSHYAGWKTFLSMVLVIPVLILMAMSFGTLVDILTRQPKCYAVISAVMLNGTATIAMQADSSMLDDLNHVNYIVSQRNIDRCREALMETMGWSVRRLIGEHKIAFMVKEAHVEYRHQIKEGDRILIEGMIRKASKTRIDLSFSVLLPNAGNKVAIRSKLVMPLVSLETGRPLAIPDWLGKDLLPIESTG